MTPEKDVVVIEIPISDILLLVEHAPLYGFNHPMLMKAFAEWLDYELSTDDIEDFAKRYLTKEAQQEGCTEQDYEAAKNLLLNWRDEHCNKPQGEEHG